MTTLVLNKNNIHRTSYLFFVFSLPYLNLQAASSCLRNYLDLSLTIINCQLTVCLLRIMITSTLITITSSNFTVTATAYHISTITRYLKTMCIHERAVFKFTATALKWFNLLVFQHHNSSYSLQICFHQHCNASTMPFTLFLQGGRPIETQLFQRIYSSVKHIQQ